MTGTANGTQVTGTYGIQGWDEKTWDGKDRTEQPGEKLTHAKIKQDFHGGIEAEATIQLVMSYIDDANATYLGLQHMNGKIGDRAGSFVLEVYGKFENGAATSTFKVIPGSGKGDLA